MLHATTVTALIWEQPTLAATLVLGFYRLLRPGKLAALRGGHVRLPRVGFELEAHAAIVCIVRAKTRHRAARVQSVLIEDPLALAVLRGCLADVRDTEPLLPGGGLDLRVRFERILTSLNLGNLPYTPASLRPGGALFLFGQRHSLMEVMFRGRWDNVRTLQHYLQEGFAGLALHRVPRARQAVVAELASLLPAICRCAYGMIG